MGGHALHPRADERVHGDSYRICDEFAGPCSVDQYEALVKAGQLEEREADDAP